MRPTWMVFPGTDADLQFFLGDHLLMAPVLAEGATSVECRSRPGTWVHALSQTFQGDQTLTVPAPLDTPRRSCCRATRSASRCVEAGRAGSESDPRRLNTLVLHARGPTATTADVDAIALAWLRPFATCLVPTHPVGSHRSPSRPNSQPTDSGSTWRGPSSGRRRAAGEVGGYVMLTRDPPPIDTAWADPLELRRIYRRRGRGRQGHRIGVDARRKCGDGRT